MEEKRTRASNKAIAARKAVYKSRAGMAQINFRVKPEIKTDFVNHAANIGESLQSFIVRACYEQIKRDKAE